MSNVKVSLIKKDEFDMQNGFIFPIWFTSDHSIDLSSRKISSVWIKLEKLSERSFWELVSAIKLGLIELDNPGVLGDFIKNSNK
jgi:hypothetical protein